MTPQTARFFQETTAVLRADISFPATEQKTATPPTSRGDLYHSGDGARAIPKPDGPSAGERVGSRHLVAQPCIRSAPNGLRCEVIPARDVVCVAPIGELDLATVDILDQAICDLLDAGFTRLKLDLRRLMFIDSTGIHLILRVHHRLVADGGELAVMPGAGQARHVLRLTGLLDHLCISET